MSNELIIKVEINSANGYTIANLNLTGNTPNTQIDVDWGDEYSEGFFFGSHTYSEDGEYTITITGATAINNYFLQYMENVVEVIIPNNITSLPDEVFTGCSNLEKVVLPNGISSIGNGFCYDCPNLVELNLPNGLEDIGIYFLTGCGLDEVIFPYGLSAIKTGALQNSNVSNVVIPKSVTSIGDYAFQDCQNLSYIEIPNSVESIGTRFGYTSPLTTIKFYSETPPTIGSDFLTGNDNCSIHIPEGSLENYLNQQGFPTQSSRYVEYPTLKHKLETLGKTLEDNLLNDGIAADWTDGLNTLADDVSKIGEDDIIRINNPTTTSFNFINSISHVEVPSNVTEIGDKSFAYWRMTSCTLPEGLLTIGERAFYNCRLTNLVIPSTVSTIKDYAFANSYITSINIPAEIQTLKPKTFYYSRLTEVSFASTSILKTIEDSAFSGCRFQEISIPPSVTSIGYRAFWRCDSLQRIIFNSTTPPTLDAEAISDSYWQLPTTCVIEVPQGRLNTYKNATNYPDPSVYTYVESD